MASRSPPLYRLVADRSGQSNALAVVLITALTIVGTGVVVGLGATAFGDTKSRTGIEINQQSMSEVDAEAAVVALGDADTRTVSLGDAGSGQYRVEDDVSRIRIVHKNYAGSGNTEVLYEADLGRFVYENDETRIAYEGGGVWRTEDGYTRMVSPPEFRYRAATLTFPVITMEGEGTASGSPDVTLRKVGRTTRVFANDSMGAPSGPGSPYDTTNDTYTNPVTNGSVYVNITSPHYQGWASYFGERTDGTVTVDDGAETVSVELTSIGGEVGAFEMPAEGSVLEVPAMAGGHPVDTFTLDLKAENGQGLQNGHWEMVVDNSQHQFHIHVHTPDQCNGPGAGTYGGQVEMTILYGDHTGQYQGWRISGNTDPDGDGDDDDLPWAQVDCASKSLELDLTDSSQMTYQQLSTSGSTNKWYYASLMDSGTVSALDPDTHPGEDTGGTLTPGSSTRSIEWVINHYFGLMSPQFNLIVRDGPAASSRVVEAESSGDLEYDLSLDDQYIQFIHITENRIEVEVDA